MIEAAVKIINEEGLHARPAALFVQVAGKFTSDVWIARNDKKVSAKSIMGLMSLAAAKGTEVVVGASGEDEDLAVKELTELISSGFKEYKQ